MKTRLLSLPLLLMLVASLAACGGSSQAVPANAIAVVNGKPILISKFTPLLNQGLTNAKLQTGTLPTPGSPQYVQIRNQVVAYLVQFAEVQQQAPKEGVSVSDADVTKFITNIAKTNFGGSMPKLIAALKQQGLSMAAAREEVYLNLLEQKIRDKVTKSAKVTPSAIKAYYNLNITQFQTAASTTRSVEYILFQCAVSPSTTCPPAKNRAEKKKADMVEQKLKNGANFEAMAKQYSDDSSTAPLGGKFTLTKGRVVPVFETVGFALKTGSFTQQPVDATSAANQGFGWFIIKALAPPKNTKAHTLTLAQATPQIKQTLLQQQQDTLFQTWLSNLKTEFQGKVTYATIYAPPTTSAITTAHLPPATTG